MNQNDDKILKLKEQIEEKRVKLAKSSKFTPITNCSLELDGQRYNIQAMAKEQLIPVMVKLNAYATSAKDLGIWSQYIIGGFHASDWLTDLQAKLAIVDRREEEQNLKAMESKLNQLLSDDKKVALELDEIEALLK